MISPRNVELPRGTNVLPLTFTGVKQALSYSKHHIF